MSEVRNRAFQEAARLAYVAAVSGGLLVRPDRCSRCNRLAPVEGHHEDYARPFHVLWLCRGCHNGVHALERRIQRAGDRIARKRAATPDYEACSTCQGTGKTARPYALTRIQRELYEYLWHHINDEGIAPSFEDIATARGYTSLATVHEHLTNLERKHWITRRFNEARAVACLVDLGGAASPVSIDKENAA